jgi:hypothetical protein
VALNEKVKSYMIEALKEKNKRTRRTLIFKAWLISIDEP